jgi:hypothetical protein
MGHHREVIKEGKGLPQERRQVPRMEPGHQVVKEGLQRLALRLRRGAVEDAVEEGGDKLEDECVLLRAIRWHLRGLLAMPCVRSPLYITHLDASHGFLVDAGTRPWIPLGTAPACNPPHVGANPMRAGQGTATPGRRQRAQHQRPAAAAQPPARRPSAPRVPAPARPDLAQQLAVFQAALPGSRGTAYLQLWGIPLALAQQLGVGYAAPGTWPHTARDWRGGRVVFPHTTPDGRLVNVYGRAVGTAEQVPKAKRHDHLPGAKGYFNAAALQAGVGPLWVCEGAFDALALMAAGAPRVVAIFGVHGWRWDWVREVRELVFALDADAAGQQQWRELARQAALRGKQVAVLPVGAYAGHKDASEAWVAEVLAIGPRAVRATTAREVLAIPPAQ